MSTLLWGLFRGLLDWATEQLEKGRRAVNAREDRVLQKRIQDKISAHLRAKRGTVRDVYGSGGMPADGTGGGGQSDQDG